MKIRLTAEIIDENRELVTRTFEKGEAVPELTDFGKKANFMRLLTDMSNRH